MVAAVLVPLAAAPASASTPASAQQDSRPGGCDATSAEAPLLVEVRTLAPRTPQRPDEPFQVAGRLVNCGGEPVRDLEVRLGVGPRLISRSAVAQADDEPVAGARRLAQPVEQAELAPGATAAFDLRLPVSQLRLGTANGVFPLTVQARARVGAERPRLQVGLAHTFLPWFPDGPIAPTRLAWVLPLVDEPRLGPDEVMLDDTLDGLLDPEQPDPAQPDPAQPERGRLQRLLVAGRTGSAGACDLAAMPSEGAARDLATGCRRDAVPMTYAVDPDLLYSVEAMTAAGGYPVLERGKRVVKQPSAHAVQWLASLREAATAPGAERSDVLALPYGDPDVVALSRPDSPVRDDVEALRRLGSTVTEQLLGAEALRSVAWVPPGPLGRSVDALAGGEVRTLLLDAGALPEADPLLGRTPNARTVLPSSIGDIGALVVDEPLSSLLEPDPTAPGWQGPRLAEQRWIAEVAALAAERPSTSRTVVVAPRRGADVVPSVLAGAIADTGRLPFLCPVSLSAAAAGTEQCQPPGTAGPLDTQAPAEPDPRGTPLLRTEDDRELGPQQVRGLGEVRAASDQFTDQVLLAGSDPAATTKARWLRARGRAASTAWRDDPQGGRRLLELLVQDVTAMRSKVRLLGGPVTLTGTAGTLQLTVQNELDQPVNVGVGLPPTGVARLESSDTALQVVPPAIAVPVRVRVEARTSGRFTVQATLLDAEGQPFGALVPLSVRSTQYGRVALAVTGAAAAVLMVAAGARIVRRALRRSVPRTAPPAS